MEGERLIEYENISSPVFKNEYEQTEPNIASLIEACWHEDANLRPSFEEVIDILDKLK